MADAELWILDRRTLRAEAAVLASRITGDWVETSLRLAAEVQRTDPGGRARLSETPAPGVFVAARSGALFGSVEVPAIGRDGLVLSLRPRTSYRARILDSEGRPAEGGPAHPRRPGRAAARAAPGHRGHRPGRGGGAPRTAGRGPGRAAPGAPGHRTRRAREGRHPGPHRRPGESRRPRRRDPAAHVRPGPAPDPRWLPTGSLGRRHPALPRPERESLGRHPRLGARGLGGGAPVRGARPGPEGCAGGERDGGERRPAARLLQPARGGGRCG